MSALVAIVASHPDFWPCARFVNYAPPRPFLDREVKLRVYAYYKQALAGDCTDHEPENVMERWKKDAWCKLRGMTRDVAEERYVKLVDEIEPNWRNLL
jgi:acyl-CoA-binding protein